MKDQSSFSDHVVPVAGRGGDGGGGGDGDGGGGGDGGGRTIEEVREMVQGAREKRV